MSGIKLALQGARNITACGPYVPAEWLARPESFALITNAFRCSARPDLQPYSHLKHGGAAWVIKAKFTDWWAAREHLQDQAQELAGRDENEHKRCVAALRWLEDAWQKAHEEEGSEV